MSARRSLREDLHRTAKTMAVLASISKIVVRYPARTFTVKVDPASPWVHCDIEPAWSEDVAIRGHGEQKFAIWRETADIYRVGEDSAVGDDPLKDDEI